MIAADVAGLLREAVAAGGYGNPRDAIRDALLLRTAPRDLELFGYTREDLWLHELDRMIDEADASGASIKTTPARC